MDNAIEETIKIAVDSMMKSTPSANRAEVEKMFRNFYENGIPIYKSMGLDEEFIKFLYATGYQSYQSGKCGDALAIFQLLSTFDPNDPKYILGKGLCFQAMHKYPNAIDEFLRYAMVVGDNPAPYWHIYECMDAMQEPWGAAGALGTVIFICKECNISPELKDRAELALERIHREIESLQKEEAAAAKEKAR